MQSSFKFLISVIGSFFLALTAAAQGSVSDSNTAPERECRQQDIIGHTYKMVSFKETPPRGEAQMLGQFPYHYITFRENSLYISLGSNIEPKTPAELEKMLKPILNLNSTYLLNSQGILELIKADKVEYNYRCIVVIKPVDNYTAGDLIVTAYTKKAKSQLFKVYRRWY